MHIENVSIYIDFCRNNENAIMMRKRLDILILDSFSNEDDYHKVQSPFATESQLNHHS